MSPSSDTWRLVAEDVGADGAVRVWESGRAQSGPAVVLVHGLEDSWETWQPLAAHLAASGLRLLALDLPWRAGNDYAWRRERTAGRWLSSTAALAGVDVAAWIGHSFGSNAVLEMLAARDSPAARAARAVVLTSPFFRPPWLAVDWELFHRSREGFDAIVREGLQFRLRGRGGALDAEIRMTIGTKALQRIGPEGFLALFDAFVHSGDLDLDVGIPALVLAGSVDPGLAGDRAGALAAAMPLSDIRMRAGYGHFCHVEHPADVGRELLDFLLPALGEGRARDPRRRPTSPREPDTRGARMPVDTTPTHFTARPGFEGANIRTWIGFKHFMYLAEAAVLDWFRQRDLAPGRLHVEQGAGLEVVDASVRLPNALTVDDTVHAEVIAEPEPRDATLGFKVRLSTERDGSRVLVLNGKLRVALLATSEETRTDGLPVPVLRDAAEAGRAPFQEPLPAAAAENGAFTWSWRIPYFYCHWSERLQHSGYVRALEEVVDRFLDDRGISVATMLDTRGWIPVVSRARVQLLADARMEETVHTVFTVEEILKDVTFAARMDCFVERDGERVPTATASIVHGYAGVRGPDTGRMASFDEAVREALLPGGVRA